MKCLTDLHIDVKENHGVNSVMGSHTDQNCAESGFGQIRGMGAANNDPNAQELMQRVSRWTTHRILKFDPDFNIMCLKEPLEKYIEDFTSGYYEDDGDEFDYDAIPDDLNLEHEVPPVQSPDVQSPESQIERRKDDFVSKKFDEKIKMDIEIDNVDKLKVTELRALLSSHELDTKGTKPILVARLTSYLESLEKMADSNCPEMNEESNAEVQSPDVQDNVPSEPVFLEDGKDIYTGCPIDIVPSILRNILRNAIN